jgi:hypothetical protein
MRSNLIVNEASRMPEFDDEAHDIQSAAEREAKIVGARLKLYVCRFDFAAAAMIRAFHVRTENSAGSQQGGSQAAIEEGPNASRLSSPQIGPEQHRHFHIAQVQGRTGDLKALLDKQKLRLQGK